MASTRARRRPTLGTAVGAVRWTHPHSYRSCAHLPTYSYRCESEDKTFETNFSRLVEALLAPRGTATIPQGAACTHAVP